MRLIRSLKRRVKRFKPFIRGLFCGALIMFTFNSLGHVALVHVVPNGLTVKIVPNSIIMTMEALK